MIALPSVSTQGPILHSVIDGLLNVCNDPTHCRSKGDSVGAPLVTKTAAIPSPVTSNHSKLSAANKRGKQETHLEVYHGQKHVKHHDPPV